GIPLREIESDHAGVGSLHPGPGAPGVLGEQFPPVRACTAEQIRVIISPTPFEKRIVWRLRLRGVFDRLGTQLRQMRKTAGPPERHLAAVGVAPVGSAVQSAEETAFGEIDVVAIALDETDGAAFVVPIDRARIEAFDPCRLD